MLRMYWPKEKPPSIIDGTWKIPPVKAAPNDTIYLVMRLYWPKTEPPSILPPGEGTWQPPAIKQAS
jgi:hypothetical protein